MGRGGPHRPSKHVLRSCAIIVENGRVLLQREKAQPFWALPGGRMEAGGFWPGRSSRRSRRSLASFPQSLPLPRSARNRFRVAETIVQEIGFYFTAQIGDALDRPGEFAGLEDHLIFDGSTSRSWP
jgi:hypothetical protein